MGSIDANGGWFWLSRDKNEIGGRRIPEPPIEPVAFSPVESEPLLDMATIQIARNLGCTQLGIGCLKVYLSKLSVRPSSWVIYTPDGAWGVKAVSGHCGSHF